MRSPDGDWHTGEIKIDSRLILVRIADSASLVELALPFARSLCAESAELASRFRDFRDREALKQEDFAEEIASLEIDTIDFVNPQRPDTGEVSFTEESGGECWTCLVVNGRFAELTMET